MCVGGGARGAVHCRDAETKPGLGLVRLNQSFLPFRNEESLLEQHWVGDGRSVGRWILSCRARTRVEPLSRIVVFWDWPCTFVGFVIRCRKKGSLGSIGMFCSAVETPSVGASLSPIPFSVGKTSVLSRFWHRSRLLLCSLVCVAYCKGRVNAEFKVPSIGNWKSLYSQT